MTWAGQKAIMLFSFWLFYASSICSGIYLLYLYYRYDNARHKLIYAHRRIREHAPTLYHPGIDIYVIPYDTRASTRGRWALRKNTLFDGNVERLRNDIIAQNTHYVIVHGRAYKIASIREEDAERLYLEVQDLSTPWLLSDGMNKADITDTKKQIAHVMGLRSYGGA